MIKLLIAFLLAIMLFTNQTQAQSQPLLGAGGSKRAVAAYVGPGDIVSGATAWYGLRAYSAAVAATGTQKAVRVRRSSDNAEQDILILTTGALDVASATAFAGGANLFVTTFYDQSGNTRNATQATAAQQPQLFLSGGPAAGLPYINFASASSQRLLATIPALSQPYSFYAVALRTSGTTSDHDVISTYTGGSNGVMGFGNTSGAIRVFAGSTLSSTGNSENVWHVLTGVANGASSSTAVDGSATAGAAGAGSTSTSLGVGFTPAGLNFLNGKISEAGLFPSNLASFVASLSANAHATGGGW